MKLLVSFILVFLLCSCGDKESYLFKGTSEHKNIFPIGQTRIGESYEVLSSADYEIRFTPKNEEDSFFLVKIQNIKSKSPNDDVSKYYFNYCEIKVYDKFDNLLILIEEDKYSKNKNIEYHDKFYDFHNNYNRNDTKIFKGIIRNFPQKVLKQIDKVDVVISFAMKLDSIDL